VRGPGPPGSEEELRLRVEALAGRTLGEIAAALGFHGLDGAAVRTKGRAGELVERALGATVGAGAAPDFPHLGIELKTIPVDGRGAPRESTFVCAIDLRAADRAEWATSRARRKLAHVLFVPLEGEPAEARAAWRVGAARFWRPTAAQEEVLRADFDELMGLIGAGGVERLTAHAGRWLQVRPKAATSRSRTEVPDFDLDGDGAYVAVLPRGFYLRARFTGALLRDPAAMPA